MARVGRPKKQITTIDKNRTDVADEIVSRFSYNGGLTKDQISQLRSILDDTFLRYNMEKRVDIKDEDVDYKDINHEAMRAFLDSKKAEGRSKTTIYNYGNEIAKLLTAIDKDYREITADDIKDYFNYRRDHDHVSRVTIQNIRMYLMSFYKWAVVDERMLRNPMDKIGSIKREQKIIETFTDEEVEILRCSCKNERDLAIVDMLSSSGMRVSELCNLDKRDVNFETGEVKVFGKGSKERICFLTGRAKIHLKWYLESRVDDNQALFVTAKKPYNRLTKNGVEYILHELGRISGVDVHGRVHPHKFRATLATNMLNKGCDISTVSATLGHQSPETTMQAYSRMEKDTIKRAHNTYVS